MTHADDPRHIVYATWIIPNFFPYMRDLLCVLYFTWRYITSDLISHF